MSTAPPFPALPADAAGALLQCLCDSQLLAALYDPQDVLRWCNAAYEREFLRGLALPASLCQVMRHGFHHGFGVRIDCNDIEAFLEAVLPRRRMQPFRTFEVDTVAGRWLWMTETLLPSGWLLSVASDITTLKRHEMQLRQARRQAEQDARTDALTGAPNRRHLFEAGAAMLARCTAAGQPSCAALLDLDHFKRINDRHGHEAGDAVLRDFALQARAGVRERDLFGRMGGEEFLLLLPGTALDEACDVVERLRQRLRPVAPAPQALPLRVTFSAGLALAQPGEALDAVLQRADRALYRAKLLGRDCIQTEIGPCGDDDSDGEGTGDDDSDGIGDDAGSGRNTEASS